MNIRAKLRIPPVARWLNRGIVVLAVLVSSISSSAQTPAAEKAFNEGIQAMKAGQLDRAVADFSQSTKLAPSFAEGYFNLGLARVQQGRWDDAIASLSKSLELKPTLRGANLFLGIARYRMNDYPAAITALQREARKDPANPKVFMWLGIAQLAADDAKAAATSLDRAASLNPGDVDILYHRGRAHMLVSKESYEEMYKIEPDSWRVHEVLAQSFVEADRFDEAAKECQQAIELRPQEPGLHEELADIYWKEAQLAKAEDNFQEELKIDSESLSSKYKLAVVSLERSKADVAAGLLSDVLRRNPRYPDAHYQLGRAESQLGNIDAAIKNFSAVTESAQSDTETLRQSYYQLSQLYRRQQKPEESRAALDSFLRLKQQADARRAEKLQDKLSRSAQMQDTVQ